MEDRVEVPCVMCLKIATKQCSGCHSFWYCGVECQRKHWRSHKMECGKVAEIQNMGPKQMVDKLEEEEKKFLKAQEIVRQHRANSNCKMVYLARTGDQLQEDMDDAKKMPHLQEKLEGYEQDPEKNHGAMVNTLFGAAEGIGAAKTLKFFEDVKPLKEELRVLIEQEGEGEPTVDNRPPEVRQATESMSGEQEMPALVPGYAEDSEEADKLQPTAASETAAEAEARLEGLAGLLKASHNSSGTVSTNQQAANKPVSNSRAYEDMDEVD